MNSKIRTIFLAAAGLVLGATAATAAPWPPAKGDLILGVRATGGTGSTTNVFFNLGPAHTLRDNPNPGTLLANLNTELTSAFGEDWAARNDLYFGIIANRNNAPASGLGSAPAENGDPSRTIYASKGTGSANSTVPWSFTSNSLGVSATAIGGFMEAIDNVAANGNAVMTLTQGGNPVEWNNSWSEWNPVPGASFSIFTGGIQRAFGSAPGVSQVKMLDIHRVPGDGTASSYVSTVYLSDEGDLWVGKMFYELTTAVFPASTGTAQGGGLYPQNATPQLTATPNTGFAFVNWTGTTTSTNNPLSVTMDAAKSYTANFAELGTITTPTFTAVTGTGATLGGNVTDLGDGTIVERGVVHSVESTNADPLIGGTGVTKTATGGGLGTFTASVAGLTSATTYAFKAFVTTSVGTSYTNVAFFTTDTTVTFTGGVGTVTNRAIRGGDSQLFRFNLAEARAVAFSGSGATGQMQWELLDASNNPIDSGTGNLDFSDALVAGDYSLRISNGGANTETFSLNLDASNEAEPKPDVSVGTTAAATTGVNVYSPAVQSALATSRRAAPVSVFFLIDNDGPLADTMRIGGTGGNGLFGVVYNSNAGNVTAAVVAGTLTTGVIDEDDAPVSLSARITPNKRNKGIVKTVRRGKRLVTTYLRKTFIGSVRASASSDATLSDTVGYQVTTTP
jgi:hypothetical protein